MEVRGIFIFFLCSSYHIFQERIFLFVIVHSETFITVFNYTFQCSKTEGMGYLNRMKNIIRNEGNELVIIGGECPVVTQMIPGVLLDRIVQVGIH